MIGNDIGVLRCLVGLGVAPSSEYFQFLFTQQSVIKKMLHKYDLDTMKQHFNTRIKETEMELAVPQTKAGQPECLALFAHRRGLCP